MTIEQAIQRLKEHKILFSNDHGWDETTIQALDIAIKSLEMWDEVKKEILSKSIIKTHSDGLKSACDIYLSGFSDGLESAFDIIEKHLKEIEE